MPKLILFTLLMVFISLNISAQKASVKGVLSDTTLKKPLELATVALLNTKDSSLVSYTLSNKKGEFSLSGLLPEKDFRLIISFAGYQSFRKNLNFKKNENLDLGNIYLQSTQLEDVVIRRGSPVVIKKDTIEFDALAFKTRPNAVVEELLRKLPGVQVNVDGTILVNGKQISKLLIDGKEFFGNDPKVATKNLDAELIAKIQVYDDRENDPDHKLTEAEVSKIVDLKLKSKIKKSTLGKMYLGGGSRERYEAGGILSSFRDTLQVSLIGMGNNLNRTGFSQNELYSMGGFDRSGGDQLWNGTFGGQGYGGMENIASGGLNVNNNYGKKLKLNLLYFFKHNNNIFNSSYLREQTLASTVLNDRGINSNRNLSDKHDIGGLIEWKPDTINQFRYQPKLAFGTTNGFSDHSNFSSNSQLPKLSESAGRNENNNNNTSFSHSFSYHRRLKKKGASFFLTHSLSLNTNSNTSNNYNNLVSYSSDLRSEIFDRLSDARRRGSDGHINATYNLPVHKKITMELTGYSNLSTSSDLSLINDKNPGTGMYDIFLPDQSTDIRRDMFTAQIKPVFKFQLSKNLWFRTGGYFQLQTVNNTFFFIDREINRRYFNWFPSLDFGGQSFSINFYEDIRQPDISQIQPITRQFSQLYTSSGNPELEVTRSKRISGNIYKYIHSKQINLNAYSGLTISDNDVINRNIIGSNGVTNSTFVNRDGGLNGYMGGMFGKQFKKSQNWQVGLNTNLRGGIYRRPFFLNADEGLENRWDAFVSESVNLNYKEILNLNARYDFSKQVTKYTGVNYNTINTYRHTAATEFSLRWPKKVIIDANYSYNYNPQIGQGFQRSMHMLNMAVSVLMLKKDRGQIKISAYDLLDQNISIYRYAAGNSVVVSENQLLRRYFLINYQYKFSIYK